LNLVADGTLGNTGVRVFLKEINRFIPLMTAMLLFLLAVTGKNYKINKDLSDFKDGIKKHTQKIGLFFQRT
jgi:hypothetical protein